VLSLARNHPSFQLPTPVTHISVSKQHSKPQRKKHESKKKRKKKISGDGGGKENERYCWQKVHKAVAKPKCLHRMGQSIKIYSDRVMVKIYQAGSLQFYQIWAFIKDSVRTKIALFAEHCLLES